MHDEYPSRIGGGDGPGVPCRLEDSALQLTAFIDYPMPVERETLPPSGPPLPPDVVEALEERLRGVTAETARNTQALAIGTPGGLSSPFDLIDRWEMTIGHGTQRARCAATPVFPAGETASERYARLLRDAGWGSPAASAASDAPADVVVEFTADGSGLREALVAVADQLDALRYTLADAGQTAASATSATEDLLEYFSQVRTAADFIVDADGAPTDAELEAARNWAAGGSTCSHVCGPDPGHVCDARATTTIRHPLPSGGTRELPLCGPCSDAEGAADPHAAPRGLAAGGWVEAPLQQPSVDRLFVIAATRVQFTEWCYGVGISPHSRRAVHVTDHRQLRGVPHGLRYLVLGWPAGPGFTEVAIRDMLRCRDALGVSAEEYEAWRESLTRGSGARP